MRKLIFGAVAALAVSGTLVAAPGDVSANCLECKDPYSHGCLQEAGDGCLEGTNPDGSEFCATNSACEAAISLEGIPALGDVPDFVASALDHVRRSCDDAIIHFGFDAESGAQLRAMSNSWAI